MSKPSQRFRKRLLIVCPLGAVLLLGFYFASRSPESTISYSGKPLEVWFFGIRDNFFHEPTRKKAQEAIDALGTNAFPFLLANLKEKRGNGNLYFRAYQATPKWIQARVYYPLLDDDIKMTTLDHIRKMAGLTAEQIQELADCVPGFANPRIRLAGFDLLRVNHQAHPAFLNLSGKLLNDENQWIRLEAAISLAESALAFDPDESALFPILIDALEDKQELESSPRIADYRYQQQPPGFVPGSAHNDDFLRRRVEWSMYRLERLMTQEHKDRFRQAIQN